MGHILQKAVKMSLKEKTSGNGQMDRILMILKKEIDPALGLYTYMYIYEHYAPVICIPGSPWGRGIAGLLTFQFLKPG